MVNEPDIWEYKTLPRLTFILIPQVIIFLGLIIFFAFLYEFFILGLVALIASLVISKLIIHYKFNGIRNYLSSFGI